MTTPTGAPRTKDEWRAQFMATRRGRTPVEVDRTRSHITEHLLAAFAAAPPARVFLYLPLPTEPLDPGMPAALRERGIAVFAPLARPGAPLDWCEVASGFRPGMLGVPEPTGTPLGPEAIRTADVVLIPALAVDSNGTRLGRGGGHYDRSLALLRDTAPDLVAVIFDDEYLASSAATLPRDAYDVTVTAVVTPTRGLLHLTPHNLAQSGPDGALSN